jgi:hypothetical protein
MTAIPSYDFGGQVAFVTAASSGMAAEPEHGGCDLGGYTAA